MEISNTVILVEPDGRRVEHKVQSVDVPLANASTLSIRFGHAAGQLGIAQVVLYTEPSRVGGNCIVVKAGGGKLMFATVMKSDAFHSGD